LLIADCSRNATPRPGVSSSSAQTISIQHSTISISAGLFLQAVAAALLVTGGAGVRMYAEESLLTTMYPEYTTYRARTARVIPFVL
jgi:protein-S-isoprenylcysteine O-methyltransferase Ste14